MNPYVDEEDLLGFHVFFAELELVTGNRRDAVPNQVALIELLQKLLLSLEHTETKVVKDYQRRCERTLVTLLQKGLGIEVQSLLCVCLCKLYSVGDTLPLFSQVNTIQGILLSKDAFNKKLPENAKLGMLNCLTLLCEQHGQHLTSSLPSMVSIGVKHATKNTGTALKLAASALVCVSLISSNDPRHALSTQAESLKLAERHIKSSKNSMMKLAGLKIVRSVAESGGAALWIHGGTPFEEIFRLTASTINDPSTSVRDACAEALGELIATLKSNVLKEAIEKEPKENKKHSLQKLASRKFQDVLADVFCEAVIANQKAICMTVAKSWVAYLKALVRHGTPDENLLVSLAVEFISILSKLSDIKLREANDIQPEIGYGMASGEAPMAQACILYGLRTGVFRLLTESGQRKLIEQLGLLMTGTTVPVIICSLEAIRVLLSLLGEVSAESASDMGITFMEALLSDSAAVRCQASAALGGLVRADPACAATMITSCLEFLGNQVEQLTSLSAPYGAMHPIPGNLSTTPEVFVLPEDTVKASQASRTKEAMNAVCGYASGLAALLVASASTDLGVPRQLYASTFEFSKKLITSPHSTVAKAWAVEMKACYTLLGALCVATPAMMVQQPNLLDLWEPALGAAAQASVLNASWIKSGKEADAALQLWWRSEGLIALKAYLASIVLPALHPKPKTEIQKIVSLLGPLIEGLTSSPVLLNPHQAPGGVDGWLAGTLGMLQLELLRTYQLLPDPAVYVNEHAPLLKLCSQPMLPASSLLTTPSTATAVTSVMLRSILNKGDDHLGPWKSEEDPLTMQLEMTTGDRGAPPYAGWECGMPVWGIADDVTATKNFEAMPFPQHVSLAVALTESQVKLYGQLMGHVAPKTQLALLETLIVCGRSVKAMKTTSIQTAMLSCISTAILSISKSVKHPSTDVAKKLMELCMVVLDSGMQHTAIIRASAEMTAVAARFGDDAFCLRLVKQFGSDLGSAAVDQRRCFLLLSIGSLFRSKGGMCLQTMVPNLVTSVIQCIRKTTDDVRLWALHGLSLLATSAGLTFMPYVRSTLELAQQLRVATKEAASMRPYLGRLANAMVALLGPELLPDSKEYMTCKSLMRQMQSWIPLTDASEGIPAALELVLYAQQLILFAPQAVPAKKHVSVLVESLHLPHPSLRHTAAVTLRHLTERDPEAIVQEGLERVLLKALDVESEAHICKALHLTLEALLFAQCPMKPSVWLEACAGVVLTQSREVLPQDRVLHKEGSLMREEIDEMDDAVFSPSSDVGRTPRLKTRLFACQCLLKIFEAVGGDPRHFDLVKARESSDKQEFLVCQLQDIVKLGFSLSTGQVEALQPHGIKLLDAVILHFGEADDPDLPETKLLFQFQAQFVSPLRMALAPVAPPLLFMSGAALAVNFLRSGLGGSDATVLKQLVGLLVEPVLTWSQLRYRSFSEWVSACVRVSLLEAHAHCTVLAEDNHDPLCSKIVQDAQQPILAALKRLWLGLLSDYMVLNRWRNRLWSEYEPEVICVDHCGLDASATASLEEAWPAVIKASALHIPSASEMMNETDEGLTEMSVDGKLLSSKEMYWRLLDITTVRLGTSSVRIIEKAKSEDGLQTRSLDIDPVCVCLGVLKRLLNHDYMSMGLCPAATALDVIEMIISILQQVIHPIVCSLGDDRDHVRDELLSVAVSVSELLLGIASGLTEMYIQHPGFISSLLDGILCCSSLLTPSIANANEGQRSEEGRGNSFAAACHIMSATPWSIIKEWQGTLVQHAIQSLEYKGTSEETMKSIFELLKISVRALVEDGGEIMNGMEFIKSIDLSAWIIWSLIELLKTETTSLSEASQTVRPIFQKRVSLFLSSAMTLIQSMTLSDDRHAFESLLSEIRLFLINGLSMVQSTEMQSAVLQSLKSLLQENANQTTDAQMSHLYVVDLGTAVAALAHEKMKQEAMTPSDRVTTAECLKYLILVLGLPCVQGNENDVFDVLIPLLIEAMECREASLMQMAVKLVTHLNSGKQSSSFKTSVGMLPPELKQQFQKGIQSAMGRDAPSQSTTVVQTSEHKPSIVLKNFTVTQ